MMRATVLLLSLLLTACASTGPQTPEQPTDSEAALLNLRLGIGYMQNGHFNVAREKLQKALQYDSSLAEAENALGVLYEQTDAPRQAEQHYQQALELKSDYLLAKMNLARLLCATGQTARGQQLFLEAADDAGLESPEIAYTGAGVCARRAGDLSDAERYYKQALAQNAFAAGTLFELASLTHATKRDEEARDYLQRYHKVTSFSPASLQLAMEIEAALGNAAMEATYAQLLRTRFADSAEAQRLVNSQ